jgi:hypothetical protein
MPRLLLIPKNYQPIGEQNTGSSAYCPAKQCTFRSAFLKPLHADKHLRVGASRLCFVRRMGALRECFVRRVGAHRLCFIPAPFTAHHVLGNSHACLCRLRDSYYQGQIVVMKKIIFICFFSKICRNFCRAWKKKLQRLCSSYKK